MSEQERLTDTQLKSASFQIYYNNQLYQKSPTTNLCSFCNRFMIVLYKACCGCSLCIDCIFKIFVQKQIMFCPIHSFKQQLNKQSKNSSILESSYSQDQFQIFVEHEQKEKKSKSKRHDQQEEQPQVEEQINDEVVFINQLVRIFPIQQYKQTQQYYQPLFDNDILCPFNKYVSRQQSNCNFYAMASQQSFTQQAQHSENCKGTSNSQRIHTSELAYKFIKQVQQRNDLLVVKNYQKCDINSKKQKIQIREQYMPSRVEIITQNYISQKCYNEYIYQRQDWFNLELIAFLNPQYDQRLTITSTNGQKEVICFDVDQYQLMNYKVLRFFCQLQCYQDQGLQFLVKNICETQNYILESNFQEQSYVNTLQLKPLIVVQVGLQLTVIQNISEYLNQIKRKTENHQYATKLIQECFPSILNNIDDRYYKIQHIQRIYLDILTNLLQVKIYLTQKIANSYMCRCHRIKLLWPELAQKVTDVLNTIQYRLNKQK